MEHLEVSCAVRRLFKSLGFEGLIFTEPSGTRSPYVLYSESRTCTCFVLWQKYVYTFCVW